MHVISFQTKANIKPHCTNSEAYLSTNLFTESPYSVPHKITDSKTFTEPHKSTNDETFPTTNTYPHSSTNIETDSETDARTISAANVTPDLTPYVEVMNSRVVISSRFCVLIHSIGLDSKFLGHRHVQQVVPPVDLAVDPLHTLVVNHRANLPVNPRHNRLKHQRNLQLLLCPRVQ